MSELAAPDGGRLEMTHARLRDLLFWALVGLIAVGFVGWQWSPAHQFAWKFDEGANVIKARLLLTRHAMYSEIWSDQPPLFTVLLAGAFAIFGQSVLVGRTLVLAFSGLALLAIACIGRNLAGRRAGLAAALLLALLPHFHQLSKAILIGLPAISVGLVAMAAGFAFHSTGKRRWVALSGALFGLSLLIKPLTAPLYLPLSALVLVGSDERRATLKRRIRLWAAFTAVAAATLLLGLALFSPLAFARQVVGTFVQARGAHGLPLGKNVAMLRDYLFADKWGLCYAGLLFLGLMGLLSLGLQRRWSHLVSLTLWLVGALAALLLHSPLRRHELFLVVPALLALGGLCVEQAVSGLRTFRLASAAKRSLTVAACIGVILAAINQVSLVRADLAMRGDALVERDESPTHREALRFLRLHTPPDSVIITDDPMLAFKSGRLVPPALAVPSFRRIEAGELSSASLIDLTEEVRPSAVLFWERRLSRATEYFDWVSANYGVIRAYPYKNEMRLIYVPCDLDAIAFPQSAVTREGIAFLGSSVPHLGVDPGDSLQMVLYFRAAHAIDQNYTLFVQLLDAQGNCWGQVDQQPFDGLYPTNKWLPGETVMQEITLLVRADAPPGEKMLAVGFYDAHVRRLPLYDTEGHPLSGGQVILSPRPVVRWQGQFDLPTPLHQQEATLGTCARFLGYDLGDEPVRPGETISLTLYWQCLNEMHTSYTVFTHLLGEQGDLVAQRDQVPGDGAFPTTGWRPGEVIADQYVLDVPLDAPSGNYTFSIGMYDLATGMRLAAVDVDGTPLVDNSVSIGQVIVHE